ncbi:class I SAM-dependent methyltransferase [Rhizorhapis sp. SPR117]|uniref:class I SAM-dependent methyltransferase n=1 Tax=Rhizorhapis sp. SPR117 TaxID=2912611 RepID=UPI001F31D841|nr:class I SAM-dependent methyltransferase [Rhizorhapis sp. SPR117]
MTVTRDEVIWCYRTILEREPESEDAIREKRKAHKNFSALRASFLISMEGQRKLKEHIPNFLPLGLPANEIEYDASPDRLSRFSATIKAAWTHLGLVKPHFAVSTSNKYLPENLSENIDSFWISGERIAAMLERMLKRHGFGSLETKTCIDYGCGAGRVTMGLAPRFSRTHAYDISPSLLRLAEQRAQELEVREKCSFHLVNDLLDTFEDCDFFFSRIVFQHNPPPMIAKMIENMLKSLKIGGMAIFQVPTYSIGYRFSIDEWLDQDHALDMQMHCLPQHVIFSLISKEKCEILEVREDDSTGKADRWISNTFVVRRLKF